MSKNVSRKSRTDSSTFIKSIKDIVLNGGRSIVFDTEGCPKRVDGQGDILAGAITSLISFLFQLIWDASWLE